jgi:hypothetical protein
VAVGCGGDDNVVPLDSGSDSTKADAPVGTDASGDTSPTGDAQQGDTGPTPDGGGGKDVVLPDVTVPGIDDFIAQTTSTLCTRLGQCCFGQNTGLFDLSHCVNFETNAGGVKGLAYHTIPADAGDAGVTLDQTSARLCLQLILTMSCTTTSAELAAMRTACYGALRGQIPANGAGCVDSIQCGDGLRCDTSVDGGKCTALVPDGGACTYTLARPSDPTNSPIFSDDCAYRGTSTPPLFCDDSNPDAGIICVPLLGDGGPCGNSSNFDNACVSLICGGVSGICVDSVVQNPQDFCTELTIRDAGPG